MPNKNKMQLESLLAELSVSKTKEAELKELVKVLVSSYTHYVSMKVASGSANYIATNCDSDITAYNELAYNAFNMLLRTHNTITMYELRHAEVVRELHYFLKMRVGSEENLEFLQENALTVMLLVRKVLNKCKEDYLKVAL